jgi:hypothetical protein
MDNYGSLPTEICYPPLVSHVAAKHFTQLKTRLITMKPSGLPARDGSDRRRQPPSDAVNDAEGTNVSNQGERTMGTDASVDQDNARGDDAVDLALAGLANFATDDSDMESIASTYFHRAIMNSEQRQPPRRSSAGETMQESEARRRRVLEILERALEISKETMDDEDDAHQDPQDTSSNN